MKPLSAVAIAFLITLAACNRAQNASTATGGDPAEANLASTDQSSTAPPPADTTSYAANQVADTSAQPVEAPDPPPPLPDYSQPPCPGDDYIWTPG